MDKPSKANSVETPPQIACFWTMSRNSAGPLCVSWPASWIYPTNRRMLRCPKRSRQERSPLWLWEPLPVVSRARTE